MSESVSRPTLLVGYPRMACYTETNRKDRLHGLAVLFKQRTFLRFATVLVAIIFQDSISTIAVVWLAQSQNTKTF